MLDLLFLGSGNAFAAEGRAFSSFLLNGRFLFDCGPTVLQQLAKADVSANDIEAVFISHYHADHFFGLPFLFLEAKYGGRSEDLTIFGPPGIEERARSLTELGYPSVVDAPNYDRHYVEVTNGSCGDFNGLRWTAASVKHVEELDSFAYRAELDGRCLVYTGDTTLCDGLLRIVENADVIVTECSCEKNAVHLAPDQIDEMARRAPGAKIVVTHLDGKRHPTNFAGMVVAEDLGRYSL